MLCHSTCNRPPTAPNCANCPCTTHTEHRGKVLSAAGASCCCRLSTTPCEAYWPSMQLPLSLHGSQPAAACCCVAADKAAKQQQGRAGQRHGTQPVSKAGSQPHAHTSHALDASALMDVRQPVRLLWPGPSRVTVDEAALPSCTAATSASSRGALRPPCALTCHQGAHHAWASAAGGARRSGLRRA